MAPLLVAASLLAANADLQRAESLFEQLKYADAAKAAQKALAVPNNDRATVLRIYELQGIIDATIGKKTALEHFRKLMSLDPERVLSRDLGPRILGPYYEAKARLGEHPPVKLVTASVLEEGRQRISVKVESDLQKLGSKVAIYWRGADGAWASKVDPVRAEGLEVAVEGDSVDWYARLFGAYDGVLLEAGSAEAPLQARPPPPEPVVAEAAVTVPVERPMPAQRKVALAVVAVGVVGLGISAGFGFSSRAARSAVESGDKSMVGARLEALQAQALSHAIAANVMLGVGLALAGTGVVLWLTGGDSAPVALVPGVNGFALVGALP